MENKTVIPIPVQGIGGAQAPLFDIAQAIEKICLCGHEYFDKVLKLGLISKLASGNNTGQDIPVEYAVYACRACGEVLDLQRSIRGPIPEDGKESDSSPQKP